MKQDILYSNLTNLPLVHSHFRRPRIDKLLYDAINSPLIIVTAGAGYGKTQAVSAFLDTCKNIIPIWMRLSKLDNLTTRFWGHFVYAVNLQNTTLASELNDMGFPNSAPLFNLFLHKISDIPGNPNKLILIFDDFYLINEPSVINFIELLLDARLKNLSVILISRTRPQLNIPGFFTENLIHQITETELCFTFNETKDYFETQGVELQDDTLQTIYSKTEGWISAIYLILLFLKKDNFTTDQALVLANFKIFELFEQEIFIQYSPKVQDILIRLSFLERSTIDVQIVKEMSNSSVNLIEEIEYTNSFIQFDPLEQTYHIHYLFLEFLSYKQKKYLKTDIQEIYHLAAQCHHRNGSIIDALGYYRKCGSYEEIWDIIRCYDIDIPQEEAALLLELIEEFPDELQKKNPLIGVIHARLLLNNSRLKEAVNELIKIKETYEALSSTPENKAVIGEACVFLAMLSLALKNYDFVEYFKTADECLPCGSVFVDNRLYLNNGNCSVIIKHPNAGELEKSKKAITCAMPHAARAMNGCGYGAEYLTLAEAAYYTGDMVEAESNAYETIYKAKQYNQNDLIYTALFTLIRTSFAKGAFLKADSILKILEEKEEKTNNANCLSIIGIIKGWFYVNIGDIDKVPLWIMEEDQSSMRLSPNRTGRDFLIRAYYLLEKEDYHNLLAYVKHLEEIHSLKGILIQKLQIQILKSIVSDKIHNTVQSMTALETAYNLAHANSLIMPFIVMGKYMRAVCDEARRCKDVSIPKEWLDMIYTKSSTYAKHLHGMRTQYKSTVGTMNKNPYNLTGRERDVLKYLCQGLTRKEIADHLYISMSTVKRALKDIYSKMGAASSTEAVSLAIKSRIF